MPVYDQPLQELYTQLKTSKLGLSEREAEQRLAQYGPNLISVVTEPLWKKLIEPFRSVFVLILFFAAFISLWHQAIIDAVIILVIIAVSALIYYVQRFSSERILRALQKRTPLIVQVRRSGKLHPIDAVYLVPGDVVLLEEGDKVPADARVISAVSLRVDESQLTGESLPISKFPDTLRGTKEVYEQANMVFQGSFVVGGSAEVLVSSTGRHTEFGRIAALSSEPKSVSPVQKKIDRLITQIVALTGAVALVAFGLALFRGIGAADALQSVIALSVSAVPEGLPVAISVILVLGMRRMAARKALVRTMSAIESIGTITTIATDKTGTLTKNELAIQDLWHPLSDTSISLTTLKYSQLPRRDASRVYDPLDAAIGTYLASVKQSHRSQPLHTFEFEHERAMSGTLMHHGSAYLLYLKGAPEKIIASSDLTDNEREHTLLQLSTMTSKGYRVIALAHVSLTAPIENLSQLPSRKPLVFDGFVAISDQLRPEARTAIAAAQRAGITVRMLTGDHFETAYHIGMQLGLVAHRDEVFDCRRMARMSEKQLVAQLEHIKVFSRVLPEYKHRLLTILKKHNITAMTGDGVNDVPALTNAHIGIAMGSGSQIAKDAGDIILLDNNFRSIIAAIHEGRTIFSNIKRMVVYLLSTNLGEVVVFIGSLIVGLPLPLTPVQILWVNLVTDTTMVIPLGLEPGERRDMRRPPYSSASPLLSRFMVSRIILAASVMGVATLTLYATFDRVYGHEYARTVAFCGLVVMQWASAFAARSDYEPLWRRIVKPNPAFYIGLTISVLLQLAALYGPLGNLLHVTPLHSQDLLLVAAISFVIPIITIELHKWIGRRYFAKGSANLAASHR